MATGKYIEMKELFSEYLTTKKLRKTEERFAVFECICAFQGHFDSESLYKCLREKNYRVSRATLYNTLDVLVESGLVVRLPLGGKAVQYELRGCADNHSHLICLRCGMIREMKGNKISETAVLKKLGRFTPQFQSLYIYGICGRCKNRIRREEQDMIKKH